MSVRALVKSIFSLLFLGLLAHQPSSMAGPPEICPESAIAFWSKFRQSIIEGDKVKVISMTKFPFLTKGTLDQSQTRKIDIKEFKKFLPSLLERDPGLSSEPTTMERLVSNMSDLPGSACNKQKNEFRVGEWVFEKDKGGWYFFKAYVED